MEFTVKQQMNSSGRYVHNVLDSQGKRVDSFTTQEAADTRAAAMNAEYERVLAIL